jgi:hypothetical protein
MILIPLHNNVAEDQCLTYEFVGLFMIVRASDIPKYYFKCFLIVSYSSIKQHCKATEI